MKDAIISTIVLAVVATIGDWIWASFLPRHVMTAGLLHGGLLCLAMGAMIARPSGRAGAGAAAGVAIGVGAAGLFYLFAPALRYGAMFPAWFGLWVMLALLSHALAGTAGTASRGAAAARGVAAGAASGLAFYLVSGMWTRWDPAAIDYLDHFGRWAFAFAPGFLAVQGRRIG